MPLFLTPELASAADLVTASADLLRMPVAFSAALQEEVGGGNLEAVTAVSYVFFVYLLLALLVERSVETLMAVYKYVELKANWYSFFENRAEQIRRRFERIYGFQGEHASRARELLNWVFWRILMEPSEPGGRPAVSADLVRLSYLRVGARVVAFLLSVLFVLLLLDLAAFNLLALVADFYSTSFPGAQLLTRITNSVTLSVLISAALISIGTEPLHKLITKVEDMTRKEAAPVRGAL